MRFGLFVPQGWRLDLVGHRARRPVGGDARARPARRRRAVGVDLGLRPLPHRARSRPTRPRHEAWTLMAAFAAVDRAGPARPDVHLHELPQPGLPGEGRRDRATSSPAAGSRWASAAAGTSTSGAPTATASRRRASGCGMLDEGVQIMRQAWTDRARRRSHGKHYQVDGAIVPAAAAAGGRHPAVDRRRRREGHAARSPRSTRSTPTSTARRRASPTSPRCCAGHCRDVGTDFDAIVRSANYNVAIGATEAEVAGPARAAAKARLAPLVGAERAEAPARRVPRPARVSARPSRSWRTSRALRGRGHDLRDLLLPGGGLRPLRASSCSNARSSPRSPDAGSRAGPRSRRAAAGCPPGAPARRAGCSWRAASTPRRRSHPPRVGARACPGCPTRSASG